MPQHTELLIADHLGLLADGAVPCAVEGPLQLIDLGD